MKVIFVSPLVHALSVAMVFFLTGCASDFLGLSSITRESILIGGLEQPVVARAACFFPDDKGVEAPSWVCDGQVSNLFESAHGVSPPQIVGSSFEVKFAKDNAIEKLIFKLRQNMRLLLTQYSRVWRVGLLGEQQLLEETVGRINIRLLKDIDVASSVQSPNDYIYVLVGVSPTRFIDLFREVIVQSVAENSDLWDPLSSNPQGPASPELIVDYVLDL